MKTVEKMLTVWMVGLWCITITLVIGIACGDIKLHPIKSPADVSQIAPDSLRIVDIRPFEDSLRAARRFNLLYSK